MQKNNWIYFICKWGPALLVMVLIFLFSSIPSRNLPDLGRWDTLARKSGHIAGYFLLTLAFLRGLDRPTWQISLIALGLIMLYAASDEFHQAFVLGRHSTPLDILIDLTGASLAVYACHAFTRFRGFVYCWMDSFNRGK
jgi:VanZ family protein